MIEVNNISKINTQQKIQLLLLLLLLNSCKCYLMAVFFLSNITSRFILVLIKKIQNFYTIFICKNVIRLESTRV